jgi:hypothetical protein
VSDPGAFVERPNPVNPAGSVDASGVPLAVGLTGGNPAPSCAGAASVR